MSIDRINTVYGELPSHLQTKKLSELCVLDGIQTGPFGSQLHKEDYVTNGTPIITVEHLGENRIVHENLPRVSDLDKARLSKYQLRAGDIVFSRVGSVDRRAFVQNSEDGWLFSGRCLRVRVDQEIIDSRWLSYFFGLSEFKNYIRSIAVGATMPSLNTKILSDLPIYFPPLHVQKMAADVLAKLDERAGLLRETTATLEAMIQAIFKSWFVKFDPVHARRGGVEPEGMDPATAALFPENFEESELGLIPAGWKTATLADFTKNQSTTFNFTGVSRVIFINTGDVSEGKFLHANYSDTENLPGQAKKVILENDILFSEIRPKNRRFAFVNFDPKEYVVSTKFMVLRPTNGMKSRYLYQLLRQPDTIEYFNIIAESRSGTFPQITFDSIKGMNVVLPTDDCIARFIEIVEPIFQKIDLQNQQQKQLEEMRDTLLPRLVSGQIHLHDAVDLLRQAA